MYISTFAPKFGGLSLVGGPRRLPKWPKPRAGPDGYNVISYNELNQTLNK